MGTFQLFIGLNELRAAAVVIILRVMNRVHTYLLLYAKESVRIDRESCVCVCVY